MHSSLSSTEEGSTRRMVDVLFHASDWDRGLLSAYGSVRFTNTSAPFHFLYRYQRLFYLRDPVYRRYGDV